MINKLPPFLGLNSRISFMLTMKGRGFITRGSRLCILLLVYCNWWVSRIVGPFVVVISLNQGCCILRSNEEI